MREHPWAAYLNPILTHALLSVNRSFLFVQRIQESWLHWTWTHFSVMFLLVKIICDVCQSLSSVVCIMKTIGIKKMFLIYLPFTLRGKKNPYNFLTLRLLVIETIQGSLACMHLSLGEYILKFLRKKEVFSSQDVSSTVLFVIGLIQLIFHWGYSANKAQSVEDEVKIFTWGMRRYISATLCWSSLYGNRISA